MRECNVIDIATRNVIGMGLMDNGTDHLDSEFFWESGELPVNHFVSVKVVGIRVSPDSREPMRFGLMLYSGDLPLCFASKTTFAKRKDAEEQAAIGISFYPHS